MNVKRCFVCVLFVYWVVCEHSLTAQMTPYSVWFPNNPGATTDWNTVTNWGSPPVPGSPGNENVNAAFLYSFSPTNLSESITLNYMYFQNNDFTNISITATSPSFITWGSISSPPPEIVCIDTPVTFSVPISIPVSFNASISFQHNVSNPDVGSLLFKEAFTCHGNLQVSADSPGRTVEIESNPFDLYGTFSLGSDTSLILQNGGLLNLFSGSVLEIADTFTVSGSTITNAGMMIIGDSLFSSGSSSITNSGTLTVGSLTCSSGSLINSGSVSGTTSTFSNSTITNAVGGSIDVASLTCSSGSLINSGSMGGTTFTFSNSTITNKATGTINETFMNLTDTGITNSGSITATDLTFATTDSKAVMQNVTGGAVTVTDVFALNNTGTAINAGSMVINTVELNDTSSLTTSGTISLAVLTLNETSTITNSGFFTVSENVTCNVTRPAACITNTSSGNIVITDALELNNFSTINNNGQMTMNGLVCNQSAIFGNNTQGTVTVNDAIQLNNNGQLYNAGMMTVESLTCNQSSVLRNASQGTLIINTVLQLNGTSSVYNNGVMIVNAATDFSGHALILGKASQLIVNGLTTLDSNTSIQIILDQANPAPYMQCNAAVTDSMGTYCGAFFESYTYSVLQTTSPSTLTVNVPATTTLYPGATVTLISLINPSGNPFSGLVKEGGRWKDPIHCKENDSQDYLGCFALPLFDAFAITIQDDDNSRLITQFVDSPCDWWNITLQLETKHLSSTAPIQNQGSLIKTQRIQTRQTLIHSNTENMNVLLASNNLSAAESQYIAQNCDMPLVAQQQRLSEQLEERGVQTPKVPWSVYVGPVGYTGHTRQIGTHEGSHYHSVGGLVGSDYVWANEYDSSRYIIGIGATGEYNQIRSSADGHLGYFKADQVYGCVYGTLIPKSVVHLAFNVIAGGGYDWYHIQRNALPGVIAKGKTSGPQATALLGLEYSFTHRNYPRVPSSLRIVPLVTCQYAYTAMQKYTEYGAGTHNLKVGEQSISALWSVLGSRMSYEFFSQKSVKIRPEVILGWQFEYLGLTNRSSATNFNAVVPYTFISQIAAPKRSTLTVGANLCVDLYSRGMIRFDYDLWYNGDFVINSFFLELKAMF